MQHHSKLSEVIHKKPLKVHTKSGQHLPSSDPLPESMEDGQKKQMKIYRRALFSLSDPRPSSLLLFRPRSSLSRLSSLPRPASSLLRSAPRPEDSRGLPPPGYSSVLAGAACRDSRGASLPSLPSRPSRVETRLDSRSAGGWAPDGARLSRYRGSFSPASLSLSLSRSRSLSRLLLLDRLDLSRSLRPRSSLKLSPLAGRSSASRRGGGSSVVGVETGDPPVRICTSEFPRVARWLARRAVRD